MAMARNRERDRDREREKERDRAWAGASSAAAAEYPPDTPASSSAAAERRDAKYVDGVALDGGGHVGTTDDEMFVDTTTRGPVPVVGNHTQSPVQQPGRPQTSALREGVGGPAVREAAERIVRERLDGGEGRVATGANTLGTPQSGEKKLGQFYFEEKK